ncbi:protein Mpv17-like [Artemia franciscana]|uniref:Mitochondrial inner membrane protein Mpv17 n=1 Tax=Artemia franciscana TaxID=6661 RepID=A0AA88LDA8_ARTSF|nr:hypothetical protein QYM36_000593 [Artemia franciscana]
MSKIWKAYLRLLEKHPAKTQIIQTGILMSTGDIISQVGVEKRPVKEIDWKRNGKFSAFGFFLAGPAVRAWYNALDKIIGPLAKRAALKKMAADQLFFAPSFLTIFVSYMALTQGGGKQEIIQKLKKEYLQILTTNYKIWPAVQMVNFYFVPLQLRILVVQVISLFWNTYLAFVSNKE